MGVMPAGMHDVDLAPQILALGLGSERQSVRLLDRQRIHVGAQRHHGSRLAAPEGRHHTGARDAGLHLEAKPGEVGGDQARRPGFLLAELRMLMNVAAPSD